MGYAPILTFPVVCRVPTHCVSHTQRRKQRSTIMSPWFIKLTLFFIFLLLLLVMAVVVEFIILQRTERRIGASGPYVRPASLTAEVLRGILEKRGVWSTGSETDLLHLVEQTGAVRIDEIRDLDDRLLTWPKRNVTLRKKRCYGPPPGTVEVQVEPPPWEVISHGPRFFAEVEYKVQDGPLLIMVMVKEQYFLDLNTLAEVARSLSQFGIHTAILSCAEAPWHCDQLGWRRPQLVLALPAVTGRDPTRTRDATTVVRDRVIFISSNDQLATHDQAAGWVSDQISAYYVQHLTRDELSMWQYFEPGGGAERKLRLIYISTGSALAEWRPPLLLGAIAVKFNKRIDVGAVIQPVDLGSLEHSSNHRRYPLSRKTSYYIIVTPCGSLDRCPVYVYGAYQGEVLNFGRMEIFLKLRVPEANDLFTLNLAMVNLFLCIDFFMFNVTGFLRHVVAWMLRVVKYNSASFVLWVVILSLLQAQFGWVEWVLNSSLVIFVQGWFCSSFLGRLVFAHWLILCSASLVTAAVAFYGCIIGLIQFMRRRSIARMAFRRGNPGPTIWPEYTEAPPRDQTFWATRNQAIVNQLLRPTMPLRVDADSADLNMIQRMAVPHLWLPLSEETPNVPEGYVEKLPTWLFESALSTDKRETDASFTSDEERENLLLQSSSFPIGMLPCLMCSICLEDYRAGTGETQERAQDDHDHDIEGRDSEYSKDNEMEHDDVPDGSRRGDLLCGLPCGHNFHAQCVFAWINRGNHACPICRWPAYKTKKNAFVKS